MKKTSLLVLSGIVLVLVIFLGFSLYIIPEGERGVSSQNNTEVLAPGLHFTWPWETVNFVTVNAESSSFGLPLPGSPETLQLVVLWNVKDLNAFLKANESPAEVSVQLQKETSNILTPAFLTTTSGPANLSGLLLQALQKDPVLAGEGISVLQVWVKGIVPNDADQAKIYANMKGLAATIGSSIIQSAEQQAEQIRNGAEQNFLQAQSTALQDAAKILGQGNTAAVKIMAPLYHQNPALFKAYVEAKAALLSKQSNS